MVWQFRRADEGDLEGIMAIERSVFEADAWPSTAMADELRSPHTYYLVASRVVAAASGGEFDGYAGLLSPRGSVQADIQTIAVSPSARRSGLGRTLMLQLLTEARQRGASEVFLEVRADNPNARSLYESLGFAAIAVRRGYYQPDGVDAVVMRVMLEAPEAALAGAGGAGDEQR